MIHHGDCIEVMATLPEASVDAIVTDPPYGLEFMGKEWDRFSPETTIKRSGWDTAASSHGIEDQRTPEQSAFGRVAYHKRRSTWECRACGKRDGFRNAHPCGDQWTAVWVDAKPLEALAYGEWSARWAEAAYRVAKPSAYLLAFGGTRTVHRMTCALEDAGWIIRDMLVWGYASGFPKSKASLKPAWEPIVMARKPGPLRMLAIDACRIPSDDGFEEAWDKPVSVNAKNIMVGTLTGSSERKTVDISANKPVGGRWPANIVLTDPIFDGGIEGVVGGGETSSGKMLPTEVRSGERTVFGSDAAAGYTTIETYGDTGTYSRFFELPRYNGPCPNCGRVSSAEPPSGQPNRSAGSAPSHAQTGAFDGSDTTTGSPTTSGIEPRSSPVASASTSRTRPSPGSRLERLSLSPDPANNVARLETSSDTMTTTISRWSCDSCVDAAMRSFTDEPGFAERPDSPRFLLVPKAARSDREPVLGGLPVRDRVGVRFTSMAGDGRANPEVKQVSRRNVHPTVKPVDLMRHLVRLVTPTGGVVLDPFLGSGTTALAAEMEGFDWIGIEREAEYVAIAEARLNGTQRGLGLEVG